MQTETEAIDTTKFCSGILLSAREVDYAGQHAIDLIILGSHGHTGLAHRLMGGVAEEIVRLAPCPVLTVKPGEHEFLTADVETQAVATPAVSRRS